MPLKFYHNPRCKKSRDGLAYLKSRAKDFIIIEYLKNGLSTAELKDILLRMNIRPFELVRTNEELYRKEFRSLKLNDEEWIRVISENPVLMKRPVLVGRYRAVIGDPPVNMDVLLNAK